ncbi:MAG: U32 family peptidase [Endomicrobiaceae bacterium]|nr:U32 family peptidase [Endomicrobiaceae bacterium]MDD3923391.1 U32 family peptidase [Endomicrobiaceae bacterium]
MKNKFKIITGFNPADSISDLKGNGINEVYCGYYDNESEKKWPVSFGCINRRGEGVNFLGWDKLVLFSKKAHKQNISVYVTFNSHYYIKEQYKWLTKALKNINNEPSITGIITNDIGLLLLLKKINFKKNITISTLATSFNSNAVNFYKNFGANRIVLDRQLTPNEIIDITSKHPDINFEIFVLSTGGCLFIDGYCSLIHCFEQLKNKTSFAGINKGQKYDITTSGAGCCEVLNCFNAKQFDINNIAKTKNSQFNISKTLGFSCNICMLYQLKDISNISLKIDSRGSNGLGVTNFEMLNQLLYAVNNSKNNNEYIKKAKTILKQCKNIKCNSNICLCGK